MGALFVLGTSHRIQLDEQGCGPEFEAHLTEICNRHSIRLIGEEMSREVLAIDNTPASVAERVARRLAIGHAYCDPVRARRRALGTTSVQEIRGDVVRRRGTLDDLKTALDRHFAIVENEWLAAVTAVNIWPVLFICGANHVLSFSARVREAGHQVVVTDSDWGP